MPFLAKAAVCLVTSGLGLGTLVKSESCWIFWFGLRPLKAYA